MTDRIEIRVSQYRDRKGSRLYEQLQDGKFAYLSKDGKKLNKVDYIEMGQYRYLPIDDKVTQVGAIPLPVGAKEYGTTKKLVEEIGRHIWKYFDCSPYFLQFSKLYIPMTWVADSLQTINYLRFLGDYGTGKSRGFDVIGYLCYKPIMFGGAMTPAPLFRMMEAWHGTLLLDECVLTDSTEGNTIVQILNTGISKKGFIWRCVGDDNIPEPFNTFGPKIVGARYQFLDSALESRCITEVMEETERDIPIELPEEFFNEQRDLRKKLLMYRLRNWNKIGLKRGHAFRLPNVSKRLKQMIFPLYVTYVGDGELLRGTDSYVEQLHRRQTEAGSTTLDGGIVTAICDLYLAGFLQITSRDVRDKMRSYGYDVEGISDVMIGIRRKGLGIEARQTVVSGERKMSIVWDDKTMYKLMRRYIPSIARIDFEQKFRKKGRKFPTLLDTGALDAAWDTL